MGAHVKIAAVVIARSLAAAVLSLVLPDTALAERGRSVSSDDKPMS